MLNRDEGLAPPEKLISDNLTHKPSASTSIWNNLAAGMATPNWAIRSFNDEYVKSPEGKSIAATFEALQRGNENPEVGWTQWGANEAANMLGQSLNPLTLLSGELGGLAMKPISALGGIVAPQLARLPLKNILKESWQKYFPETAGAVGEKAATAFGIGAGVTLPQATIDNFNAELGQHDILGMAKEMAGGGIFGMALGTIPFAWGIVKAKINRARGRPPGADVPPDEIEKMVQEGVIDEDTAQFMRDMDITVEPGRKERVKEFQDKATKYVADQGHEVDTANHTASFEILNRDQMANLQSATVDQLVADYIPDEHKFALSDFTVQAGIDEMREKPGVLDGVRGYVEYADQNLANKDSILAKADALVDEHLETTTETEFPLDQKSILESLRIHKNADDLPFTVPEEVVTRIRIENKIDSLKLKNESLFKKYEETGNQKYSDEMKSNNKKIEQLESELIPLKSAKEELTHIKETLLPGNEEVTLKTEYPFDSKNTEILKSEHGEMRLDYNLTDKEEITGNDRTHVPPKTAHVKFSRIEDKFKGKGYGKNLYIAAINHALKKGLGFMSDTRLSEDVVRVYKSLQKMGYKFEINKDVSKNNLAGGNQEKYVSKNGKPIFRLISVPEKARKSKLRSDYKATNEYHRLQDLAEVWHPAKTLLDRINLEEAIKQQEAYRDLAKQMLEIADENVGRMADQEKVKRYLGARANPRVNREHVPSTKVDEVAKSNDLPADHEAMIAEQDVMVETKGTKSLKPEYEHAREKFNEFKKSEGIFNNFIKCVLGSING